MGGGGHPAPPHPFILQICVFNYFREIIKFHNFMDNNIFREIVSIHQIAKFKYLAKVITYLKSQDSVLQS